MARVIGTRVALTCLTILLLHVPSAAGGQAPVPGSVLSRDWKRLVTPGFIVIGNAREGDLRRVVEELERFRLAFHGISQNVRMDSPVPMMAVVFRDDRALRRFKPRRRGKPIDTVAAYFAPHPDVNYIVLAPSDQREFTYRVIFHEYTHFLANRNAARFPTWLNEGIADFYSTFNGMEQDGRMIVGRPIVPHLATMADLGGFIPLAKLISPDAAPELMRDERSMHRFYAESWALTHYLIVGENGALRPKLREFMARLRDGAPAERSFKEIFGENLGPLERALRAYVRRTVLPALQLPAQDVDVHVAIEPVTEVEAQQLQGDLLVRMGAVDEADEFLGKAAALDPGYRATKLSRARGLIQRDRPLEAAALLDARDLGDSGDFALSYLRGESHRLARQYERSTTDYRRAIALQPEQPAPYYGLSLSLMMLGQPESLSMFAKCVMLSPGAAWYQRHLLDGLRLARDTYVISDAVNFVHIAGWQDEGSPYVMFAAALTDLRAGRTDQAAKTLDDILAHVESDSWQATIVAYLRGRLSARDFIEKASSDGLRTEAHAYVGIKASIDGDREAALTHLRWVRDKGSRDYIEYGMALGELDRLGEAEIKTTDAQR